MKVIFTAQGENVHVNVDSNTTVEYLKDQIRNATGIPDKYQDVCSLLFTIV